METKTKAELLQDLKNDIKFQMEVAERPFEKSIEVDTSEVLTVKNFLNFIEESNIPQNATIKGGTEYEEYEMENGGCGTNMIYINWLIPQSEMSTLDKIKKFGNAILVITEEFERVIMLFQKFGYNTSEVPYPNRTIQYELLDKGLESFIEHLDKVIVKKEDTEEGLY